MESNSLSDHPGKLQVLRGQVALLRQQLYWQPDLNQATELMDQLVKAEKQLRRLERDLPLEDGPAVQGVLLDMSSSDSQTMSSSSEWGVRLELRQSHIPTGIVHLFEAGEHPLINAQISFHGDELARLRVSCWVEGYSDLAIETTDLTLYQRETEIKLLPVFRSSAIREIHELRRATLHFQVLEAKNNRELYRTFPIWLLPQSSAYLWIRDPVSGQRIDLTSYLAAWVTPNDPDVMQILRRAADLHSNKMIRGYQENEAGVARQVEAIFKALKAEGIRYVNSVLAFGAVPGVSQQRVRLPREALANLSANCLDGTLLMASLLEAASLNPGMVLIPGHAFLAWETKEGIGKWDYLETTMIGTHEFAQAQQAGRTQADRWQVLAEETRDPWSFKRLSLHDLRFREHITPTA
jgi:hypothetical protein